MRIFDGFLDVEEADRLSPFKSETPKSRENSRFWASSDYTRHPKFYNKNHPISAKQLNTQHFKLKKGAFAPFFLLATATAAALSVVVITTATVVTSAKSVHTVTAEEPEDKENDNPCAATAAEKSVIASHHFASLLWSTFVFLSHCHYTLQQKLCD